MRVDFLAIRQSLARAAVVHGKHAVAEVGLGVLRVCLHLAQRVLGLVLRARPWPGPTSRKESH